jgi:hypothetical protein
MSRMSSRSKDLRLLLGCHNAGPATLECRGFSPDLVYVQQGLVPMALKVRGNQAIGRIDFVIATFGQNAFVFCSFDSHLPLTHDGLVALLQLVECGQSQLQLGGLQGREDLLADGIVEKVRAHSDAALLRQSFPAPPIAGCLDSVP